jgi:hypothetical protein
MVDIEEATGHTVLCIKKESFFMLEIVDLHLSLGPVPDFQYNTKSHKIVLVQPTLHYYITKNVKFLVLGSW